MKKNNFFKGILYASLSLAALLAGCSKEDDGIITGDVIPARIYVVNEGGFANATASISRIEKDGTVVNDYFKSVNNRPLGSVGQSITLIDGKYFIAVNNSAKIEVVNAADFKEIKTISYSAAPFSPNGVCDLGDGRALVSDAVGHSAWILDLASMEITGSVDLGMASQNIAVAEGKVFVATSEYDMETYMPVNRLKVMPISNLSNVQTVAGVYPSCGTRLNVDSDGMLWILEEKALKMIDPETIVVTKTVDFPEGVSVDTFFGRVDMHRDNIYFTAYHEGFQKIFKISAASGDFPAAPLFRPTETVSIYNLAVSPEGNIFIADAYDFMQGGYLREYEEDGTLVKSFSVGITPQFIYFVK